MAKLHFVDPEGVERTVDAPDDMSVMEAAVNNGIPGIDADCGGACACATCHVTVLDDWFSVVGPPGPDEMDLLELVDDVRPTSRLSCQIRVTDAIDGLRVQTPASQH